jgi:hypothetical protein
MVVHVSKVDAIGGVVKNTGLSQLLVLSHHAALGRVPYECMVLIGLGALVQIPFGNEQQFEHHGQNECQLSN